MVIYKLITYLLILAGVCLQTLVFASLLRPISYSLRAQTALCGVVAIRYQHHQQQSEKTSHFRRSCPLIRNMSCAFKIEKS